MDDGVKTTLQRIPLLTEKSGPRDAGWVNRLKQEYKALIAYMQMNKDADNDWFRLEANANGTKWSGQCWYIHNYVKHQFDVEFEIPVTYPKTPFEIKIPELDGMTSKMYRGGKICLTIHFKPLWAKNAPHFGIAHALALGLAPWLAAEVPDLVAKGMIDGEGVAGAASSTE